MTDSKRRPGVHDWVALWVLRVAKRGKTRHSRAGAFYEQFFQEAHAEQFEKDIRAILKREEVQRAIARLEPRGRWIDLGCGVGHTLKLFPAGVVGTGVDYSLTSLRIATDQMMGKGSLLRASGERLPLTAGSVDVLVCLEVLEHLENDRAVLGEVARVLKNGGWLLISVPDTYYFPVYLQLMGHYRHYSEETFNDLLAEAGLTVIETFADYKKTGRRYLPLYVLLEALNRMLNCLSRRRGSIYQRRLPLVRDPVYERWVVPLFRRLGRREARERQAGGTFVLARKMQPRQVRALESAVASRQTDLQSSK